MPYNHISGAIAILRQALAGEVINNQLNPLHLAVATNGYRIQSHTLRIPDWLGFFSPGPQRLQTFEGCLFISVAGLACIYLTWGLFSLLFFEYVLGQPQYRRGAAVFVFLTLFHLVFCWLLVISNKRRAPGFEWEDWKVRKD